MAANGTSEFVERVHQSVVKGGIEVFSPTRIVVGRYLYYLTANAEVPVRTG